MLKTHGGFKTGDEIELKLPTKHKTYWAKEYIIVDFSLMKVRVKHKNLDKWSFWVPIFHIRKPNLKVGR